MPRRLAAVSLLSACTTLGAAPADKPTADKPGAFWRDCGKGLRLGILADRTRARVGQRVQLTLLVNNHADRALGGFEHDRMDYTVYLFDGVRYFQRPRAEVTNNGLVVEDLQPGATRLYTLGYAWRKPGTYRVHFAVDPGERTQPGDPPPPWDKKVGHQMGGPIVGDSDEITGSYTNSKGLLLDPYGRRPGREDAPRTHDLVITVTE